MKSKRRTESELVRSFSGPHGDARCFISWREAVRSVWHLALICAILCLLTHVIFAFHSTHRALEGDMIAYDLIATSLYSGDGFATHGNPSAGKSPAYPFFVAAVWSLFGKNLLPLFIIQSFIAALKCAVVVFLAYRVTRKKPVALLAGLAVAFYFPMVLWYTKLLGEILFDSVALVALLAFEHAISTRKGVWYVLSGLVVGLAIYCRPNGLFLPVIFLGMAMYSGLQLRKVVSATVLLTVVSLLTVLPWTIRNYAVFGRFTPLPALKGVVLWHNWRWDHMQPYNHEPDFPLFMKKALGDKVAYEADDIMWKQAIKEIKAQPGKYIESAFCKLVRQWLNLCWPDQNPSLATKLLALTNSLLLLFAIPGLRRPGINPMFRAYTIMCLVYIVATGVFFSSAEVRYAYWIFPCLFILAADTLCERLAGVRKPGGQVTTSV